MPGTADCPLSGLESAQETSTGDQMRRTSIWDGFHPSSGQESGCGGPSWSPVLLKAPSSHHGQYRSSHNIHSCQRTAQPVGAFCKQQPCSLPQWLRQRPAVAGWAQLARKAEAEGSRSGREAGAQSAVLFFAFPSDMTPARGWALLHIFRPASWAVEVLGLHPFLHPLAAAMAPPE